METTCNTNGCLYHHHAYEENNRNKIWIFFRLKSSPSKVIYTHFNFICERCHKIKNSSRCIINVWNTRKERKRNVKEHSLRSPSRSMISSLYILHPFPLYSLFFFFSSFRLFFEEKKSLFINKNYERNEFGGSSSSSSEKYKAYARERGTSWMKKCI